MDWLAEHGPTITLIMFFTAFIGIAAWAFRPSLKSKFQSYGQIPLEEENHGEKR